VNIQNHYSTLLIDEKEREILCLILDKNQAQFNLGLTHFSKIISSHIGKRDLENLLQEMMTKLVAFNAFMLDNQEFLTPCEALEMIESVLYLEILHEEFQRKFGRRSFFISNFKSVDLNWVYFSYEMLLCMAKGYVVKDLLAYAIGSGKFSLNIISTWTKEDRIKSFINLTRQKKVCIFQDENFIGFMNDKKIIDIDQLLQKIFDEINALTNFFIDKKGIYFEIYSGLEGRKVLPTAQISKNPASSKTKEVVSPLQKKLSILGIKEVPVSKSALKKIFYRLAVTTHPDKFAHVDKGTRTEIAIGDKFREIYDAYEYIEKKLEK